MRRRVLVDWIEAGSRSREVEKERLFTRANRLTESAASAERQKINKELAVSNAEDPVDESSAGSGATSCSLQCQVLCRKLAHIATPDRFRGPESCVARLAQLLGQLPANERGAVGPDGLFSKNLA